MGRRLVFMFSGQGSQYYHMGVELFSKDAVFRRWMLKLDDLAQEINGQSILRILYDENRRKSDSFDRLLFTHPAVFMVEYALAQLFLEHGIEPAYVLGASLGEFTAAAVAGVMALPEIMACVIRQAEIVESQCEDGGMLAIVHSLDLYDRSPLLRENSELAAENYQTHFVVSGYRTPLLMIRDELKARGILHELLPIRYGFHSVAIEPAAEAYLSFLSRRTYGRSSIPLMTCSEGIMAERLSPTHFWDATRKPIRFQKALEGLRVIEDVSYIDMGPTGTLAAFIRNSMPKESPAHAYAAMSPFSSNLVSVRTAMAPLQKSYMG
ncbi:MAG TPA: acyltransferase domain-containing protein [Symbiobacteriaceae bacterium]